MQTLRLPILALGTILFLACGTTAPQTPSPRHIRQSARQLRMADWHYIKGCYPQALAHYQQAHERYTAADHIEGVANSLNGLANVYFRLDELPSAILAYNDAIEAYGLVGVPAGAVRAMCNKAAVLIVANRIDEAGSVLDQADELAMGHSLLEALRHKTRAMLKMQHGATKEAEILLKRAIEAALANGSDQLASASFAMGQLLLNGKDPARAIDYFERSLSLDRDAGAYNDIAQDLAALGRCHDRLAQHQQAAAHYKRSIKIYALLGNAGKVQSLATLLENQGKVPGEEIQATRQWVNQWLAGDKEANLCR